MKHKATHNPRELLTKCGFVEAPDMGMQIVIRQGINEIPVKRYHAKIYGQTIDLHLDSGSNSRSHKALSYNPGVIKKIEEIKRLDSQAING